MIIDVSKACDLLKKGDDILILSHQKPDGDTLGSGFSLKYALEKLGKRNRIECSDGFPSRYGFMYQDGFDPDKQEQFTPGMIVAVDIADTQLLGKKTEKYKDRVDLCIDHHPSNTHYAKNLVLDSQAAATVQLISKVIDGLGVKIDLLMATCIYTGLATDTGCFRYSNVTAETMYLAARMMEYGVDAYGINKLMFETKSVARMEVEKLIMETLEYYYDKRCAVIVISDEMVKTTGVSEEELEGVSAIPRQIEGVEVAVTLRQKGARTYRVSMRTSEYVDASRICARLGGGGHARAAGCTVEGTLVQVKKKIIEQLKDAF